MTDIDVKTRLTDAADRLDKLADGAEYKEGRWYVDAVGPIASLEWLGSACDVLTATWKQAALVDVFSPDLARLLAKWLRSEATDVEMCDRINSRDPDNPGKTRVMYRPQASDALALADHVLKPKAART